MRSTFFATLCFSISLTVFGAGCAAQTEEVSSDVAFDTDSSESAIAYAKLDGSYELTEMTGAPVYPRIETLVFQNDKTFFASVDTGIRCFRAPCPSQGRLDGTFKQSRKTVTLSYDLPADGRAADVYTYAFAGDKLTMTKKNGASISVLSFKKRESFCLAASDCGNQGLMVPMCIGHFTCSPENTCGFSCGSEPKPRICATQTDCGDEETCRPGLCKMFCLAGDTDCCAPSLCVSAASR